ncbi:hypothetical protein KQI84_17125 [bacterium]|nr:hypothetical protein [bacterium]
MRSLFLAVLAATLLSCASAPTESASPFGQVGIDGDWLTVDGERFLVVAVGYEIGARPGRAPWDHDDQPQLLQADFERIRAAGFNTIRTWGPLKDWELEMAAEYGLWVIQGNWIDPGGDFADPAFQEHELSQTRINIERSSEHPNILMYLMLNEPHGDAMERAGTANVASYFGRLAEVVREEDPGRPFSFSNCVFGDYLPPDVWPVICQNVYPYSPDTIRRALGYRHYLEVLKRDLAPNKPFLITEFGLSVSPTGDGRGYGGNSIEQQRDGVVALWDDVINSGATGGAAFMWIDGWWKRDDPDTHNDHAEEWYGLLEAETDYVGTPRPVYYALADYNQAIRVAPHDEAIVEGEFPIEVWGPDVAQVQYRVNKMAWRDLDRSGNWWRGTAKMEKGATNPVLLATRGLDADGQPVGEKTCRVWPQSASVPTYQVAVLSPKDGAELFGSDLPIDVQVLDNEGTPIVNQQVRVEIFLHNGWYEEGADVVTDADGKGRVILRGPGNGGIVSIAAGVENPRGRGRTGDYIHVRFNPTPRKDEP